MNNKNHSVNNKDLEHYIKRFKEKDVYEPELPYDDSQQ